MNNMNPPEGFNKSGPWFVPATNEQVEERLGWVSTSPTKTVVTKVFEDVIASPKK